MLKIAIVEDDPQDFYILKKNVEQFFHTEKEPFVIQEYHDGLRFIRNYEEPDIVFMDIKMDKLDGLDAARLLRKISTESILIFVTRMAQFAIHGYKVDALDFIIKPVDYFSTEYVLKKAMKRIKSRRRVSLVLKIGKKAVSVSTNDIYFIEVFNHDLIYHTGQGEYKVRGQLGDIKKQLEERHFLCCNRSYLVNLQHVTSVQGDHLVVNETSIPISRSHRKEFAQYFADYVGENI